MPSSRVFGHYSPSLNLEPATLVTGWQDTSSIQLSQAHPGPGHTRDVPLLHECLGSRLKSSGLGYKHFTHKATFLDWFSFLIVCMCVRTCVQSVPRHMCSGQRAISYRR